jgi:hypothetical protein
LNPSLTGLPRFDYTLRKWTSPTGNVAVTAYNINNGLAGVSVGANGKYIPTRIAVLSHELGHVCCELG